MTTKQTSYTPGPWHVSHVKVHGRSYPVIYDKDDNAIAELYLVVKDEPTSVPNARLIADAPRLYEENQQLKAVNADLLEALQSLIDGFASGEFKRTHPRQDDSDPYHPALVAAHAAIAKALEGGE